MKWPTMPISTVAEINPRGNDWATLPDDTYVSFVPMAAVSEDTASIVSRETRRLKEVRRGYTPFREGDVLLAKITPCMENGKVALALALMNGLGFGSTEFHVLRSFPEVLFPKYLFYFVRQQGFRNAAKQRMQGGVGQQRVPEDFVKKYPITLPPLSEQRRIVEILDQADALRRKRAEADAKAARILPALFYQMFGDPATNPMGWPTVQIRDLVASISRRDPGNQPHDSFVYIDISGVDGQLGIVAETKMLFGAEAPSRARQVVKANDVIVSTVRPYLRATALVPQQFDDQICSTGFSVLRAKEGYGFGFLYALTRLQWFTDQLNVRARGASYPAVTDGDVLNLHVLRPDAPDFIKEFDHQIIDLLFMQDNRTRAVIALDNLFGSLLHRAFSGDLTARWREAHLEELLGEMEQQARALAAAPGREQLSLQLG